MVRKIEGKSRQVPVAYIDFLSYSYWAHGGGGEERGVKLEKNTSNCLGVRCCYDFTYMKANGHVIRASYKKYPNHLPLVMSTATANLNTTVKWTRRLWAVTGIEVTGMHTTWVKRAGGIIRMVFSDTSNLKHNEVSPKEQESNTTYSLTLLRFKNGKKLFALNPDLSKNFESNNYYN